MDKKSKKKSKGDVRNLIILSIIIPVYNGEQYIMNLYKNYLKTLGNESEIIFVDDGSNDKSGYILDNIRADNVKIFHIENKGASHARN